MVDSFKTILHTLKEEKREKWEERPKLPPSKLRPKKPFPLPELRSKELPSPKPVGIRIRKYYRHRRHIPAARITVFPAATVSMMMVGHNKYHHFSFSIRVCYL